MSEQLNENWRALRPAGAPLSAPALPIRTTFGQSEPQTASWWLRRLYSALVKRAPVIQRFDDYYIGDHPLPWLPEQAREEFRRILRMTRTNYMGLVIDAQVERMNVEGFRVEDAVDDKLWRIWQANNLDGESDQAWLEAAKSGASYAMVGPNAKDSGLPIISIEHPSQAIVEHEPGRRRHRAAGLKVWRDDWTGNLQGELHLPGWVIEVSAKGQPGSEASWTLGEPRRSGIDVVPLVELPNNPKMLIGGVSELADLTDPQDRINKTVADRLITQDFGAFPQKWASGLPDTDEQGNALPPIDIGRNRLVSSNVVETKYGQWEAAPLDPYSFAKREDVKDIASRSRTPAQYLLGEMNNVNGETLKASESGLVSKVGQRQRGHDSGLEDVMNLAAHFAGLEGAPYVRMETIWRNPQYRTEGEATDAAIKRYQAGVVPLQQTREDLGYSQEQIRRMTEMDRDEALDPIAQRVLRSLPDAADVSA